MLPAAPCVYIYKKKQGVCQNQAPAPLVFSGSLFLLPRIESHMDIRCAFTFFWYCSHEWQSPRRNLPVTNVKDVKDSGSNPCPAEKRKLQPGTTASSSLVMQMRGIHMHHHSTLLQEGLLGRGPKRRIAVKPSTGAS